MPARVIADLRELDRRTGGPGGARRLCWGEDWRRGAGASSTELLAEIGLEPERDEAGNLWADLEGERRDRRWRSAPISTRSRTAAGSTARSG